MPPLPPPLKYTRAVIGPVIIRVFNLDRNTMYRQISIECSSQL
jgi:hypothetical protein